MATFSFGVTPGAPGTYINETVGNIASAGIASFSTVYMLVETEENVSVTKFPFNQPIFITSLSDYRALVGGVVPEARIPLLSYNCVNAFFQNAQVGDLRVVRVGTPNQIVEIEVLSSGTKISSSGLPSHLEAGDVVYVQLLLNGLKLVAGDGSSGYSSSGEWLGVPVKIPVDYIDGDPVNNRKISKAISAAIAEAIEGNPSVRSSVYVRDYGLVNDLNPASNSENGFITIAASTYDGSVSVVTQQNPTGSTKVLMNNAYDVQNIVGLQNELVRVPQDYIQCINTAFDGQQDQGYLITPTAYAQFDAAGRSAIGAAAAAHSQSNNFKWMALSDPGPYLVTDINKYSDYVPHLPASDLITGLKYLVENVIYEWTGSNVTYDKLRYQTIISGSNPEVAVKQSTEAVAVGEKIGAIDPATYTLASVGGQANVGKILISSSSVWPSDFQITEVTLTADPSGDFGDLFAPGQSSCNVFIVAPALDTGLYGPYPSNGVTQVVYIARTATEASSVYTEVMANGGSANMTTAPADAFLPAGPTGSTAEISYGTPAWDLFNQVKINGQSSNLIQNISGAQQYVNTAHFPGTLQESTRDYQLGFVSRTFLDPNSSISATTINGAIYCKFKCMNHGLQNGRQVFFTQAITNNNVVLFKASNINGVNPYYVRVINSDYFVLASSYSNYLAESYVAYPGTPVISTTPTILYSRLLGGELTSVNLAELSTVAMVRGRKYGLASGSISNTAYDSEEYVVCPINVSIYMNNSAVVLGEEQIFPYGETPDANWLPSLALTNYGEGSTDISNYVCIPTVNQKFGTEAYLVPAIESILGGEYNALAGNLDSVTDYTNAVGLNPGDSAADIQNAITLLDGVYFLVSTSGLTPDGLKTVSPNDRIAVVFDGSNYNWVVVHQAGVNTIYSLDTASLVGGTGYTNGTFNNIPLLSSGSGLDAFATVVVAGGSVTSVTLVDGGINFTSGETLTTNNSLLGGGTNFSIDVDSVVSGDGDISSVAHVCYGSQVELSLTPEQTPPANLWRFDAITAVEIIDNALRGVGFNGEPQAVYVESGIDTVNKLYEDSQRYFNPFGFIAYYGSYIQNASGQIIPPSPYVTGVAIRRYRAEGFQFPPAGVKYQLSDAVATQIAINSAQQNLLNPDGCNAVRTLPGYPDTAVFIWGGRTRVNKADADQRKFQFVNTRVIQNVVYGSLRNAFDSQIFSIIDGFGIVFNQIVSIGNSVLVQLWSSGALFGARPSDAFQVICDNRINTSENLENGIVYVKVFDVPVPTLERIEVDLIRVSIGQMGKELETQGLGAK